MEKLIKALKTIIDECQTHAGEDGYSCKECPMGTEYGKCCVTDLPPNLWHITEPQTVVRIME